LKPLKIFVIALCILALYAFVSISSYTQSFRENYLYQNNKFNGKTRKIDTPSPPLDPQILKDIYYKEKQDVTHDL
jgi:hypothetical protein